MSKNNAGLKIRQLRELKGFSQEYMASLLSISQRAYSKIERGEIKLDWNKIAEIAAIFEMDPVSLVSFDEDLVFASQHSKGKTDALQNILPQKLIELYEKRITALENEILFLREQLSKK